MDDKEKTEALKHLLAIREARLEHGSDPLLRGTLDCWIKEAERAIPKEHGGLETWKKL